MNKTIGKFIVPIAGIGLVLGATIAVCLVIFMTQGSKPALIDYAVAACDDDYYDPYCGNQGECSSDGDCPSDGANCSEAVQCGSPGRPWSVCHIRNWACPPPPPPPSGPCEDGIDNDGDGYVDYGDFGCHSSSGITEAQGPWPRFVHISVSADQPTSWQINCPPNGSYNTACPYVGGSGTGGSYQFAGGGDYSVYADNATITGDPNPSYSMGGTVGSLQVHDDFSWNIEVGPPPPPAPTVDIQCNAGSGASQGPCLVPYNSTATLTWASSNATSCTASNAWSGAKTTSGSQVSGAITASSTFTLSCSGPGGSGSDSVVLQNPPNSAPVTSAVRVTEPNYCSSAPSAFVEWTYSDPDSNAQAAYQIQIDDDAAYGSPAIDTGTISCTSCRSYLSPATLGFNTTYYARVRTTDTGGATSPWQSMSLCSGSGCQPGNASWRTPQHAYPNNVDFSWLPANPSVNQIVQFTNTAICYAVGNTPTTCASWAWNFGDGGSASTSNPTHTYATEGSFPVTFRVTDAQGYSCPQGAPLSKTLSVQKKIPTWKEVAPR